jgi:O-antigen ligase
MTALARLAERRQRLRERLPLAQLHALFVALVLLTTYERLYRDFYYVLLLIPFLVLLDGRDWQRLAGSWALRFCLAYLGLLWLSLFWTPDVPANQFVRVGRHVLANFSFVALTAWLVGRDHRHAERLCRWIAWAALITALVSLYLFYVGHAVDRHPFDRRLVAWLWGNPNTAGAVFGLACVAAAAGPARAAGRASLRLLYLAIAAFLAVCVALAGSRAAFAGVAVSGAACLAMARAWRPLVGLAVAGLVFAGLAAAGWIEAGGWLARADNGRMELWSHFWGLGWQRPWHGWGLRQDLAFTITNGLRTDDPHNMLLETFMRIGLPGALAWSGVAVAGLVAGFRHWRRAGGLAPLALMIFLLTQGLFESAVPINGADWFWIFLWIPVGVAAGVGLPPAGGQRPAAIDAARGGPAE